MAEFPEQIKKEGYKNWQNQTLSLSGTTETQLSTPDSVQTFSDSIEFYRVKFFI